MTKTAPVTPLAVTLVLFKPDQAKLHQCLQSLMGSKGISLSVHVLDNSPSPLPDSFLATYQGKIEYIYGGHNVGFGAGHNQLFQRLFNTGKAPAKYTLVLNPDAYFGPDLLASLLQRMEADPRIGLCIPRIANPDDSIQLVNKRLPSPAVMFLRPFVAQYKLLNTLLKPSMRRYLLQDMDLNRPLTCPFISGCFMFFRTSVLQELKGFDDRYFLYMEDVDLSRRAATKGLNVVFSDLTCNHHWERAAYKNKKLFRILVHSAFKYFTKWGWVFDCEGARLNKQTGYYKAP